jgi:hypothetical protein
MLIQRQCVYKSHATSDISHDGHSWGAKNHAESQTRQNEGKVNKL